MYDCGFSGVYIRRSLGNTRVEYNYIDNVTIAPDENAWFGSAPVYLWGKYSSMCNTYCFITINVSYF